MYVCMDSWMCGLLDVWTYWCIDAWLYGCVDACMDAWMYVFMSVWAHEHIMHSAGLDLPKSGGEKFTKF